MCICWDWTWKVQTKRVDLAGCRGRGGGCPTSLGQVTGRVSVLGAAAATRPCAQARRRRRRLRLRAPGGSRPPGLDSRPATSSDALSSASAPDHRRKVRGTFMRSFNPSTPCVYFWLPRFFPFQEWSPFVKLYLRLAHAGGSRSRPPWQRGHPLLKGTEWGEGPLKAVFPVWIKIWFPKSQVLPSRGVLYYDVACDACNGFSWPFRTEGRASLQRKVHVKQGKFAAT